MMRIEKKRCNLSDAHVENLNTNAHIENLIFDCVYSLGRRVGTGTNWYLLKLITKAQSRKPRFVLDFYTTKSLLDLFLVFSYFFYRIMCLIRQKRESNSLILRYRHVIDG